MLSDHHRVRAENRAELFTATETDELERIMILVRAIRDAAWNRLLETKSPDLVFVIQEAKEHLAIVDALILNDAKLAKRALYDHLRSGTRYIVRAVED